MSMRDWSWHYGLPPPIDLFGKYLNQMKWINFGGGHHITQPDYDLDLLCETVTYFREKYNLDENTLYKKKMLIEIFHSDVNKKGLDKIELIEIKERI